MSPEKTKGFAAFLSPLPTWEEQLEVQCERAKVEYLKEAARLKR